MPEKKEYVCVNGKIVPEKEARLGVYSRAFQFGDGIYETVFVNKGRVYDLDSHLKRLHKAGEDLEINIRLDVSNIENLITILSEKNQIADKYLSAKIIVIRGENAFSKDYNPAKVADYIILVEEYELKKELYEEGVSLALHHSETLFHLPQYKTISQMSNVMAYHKAREEGFYDALFIHNGNVLETISANIFIYSGGTLSTPSENVLEGITRENVVFLAGDAGIEALYKRIEVEELFETDEVFICNTIIGIVPVSRIGHINYKVGDVTKKLISLLNEDRGVVL